MTTTQTVTASTGRIRTDVYRDGRLIGFVGCLDSGWVAFVQLPASAEVERLGAFTDAADAIAAVERAAR